MIKITIEFDTINSGADHQQVQAMAMCSAISRMAHTKATVITSTIKADYVIEQQAKRERKDHD